MIDGFLRFSSSNIFAPVSKGEKYEGGFHNEAYNQQKPKKGNKKRKVWEKVRFERKGK